jgi:hypothetical protein
MRRRLEPIDDSLTTLTVPMSPVALTWVPPHSSTDGPGLEDAHDVAVLVAEERDRSHRLRLVLAGLERPRPLVAERLGVDELLDLLDLLGGDRLVVREVEPEPVGPDVRTGLLDVVAEHPAQRPVQQVGRGVVAAGRVASFDVDARRRLLTRADRALDDPGDVPAQVREGEGGVEHLERPVSVAIVPVSPICPPLSA